MTTLPSSIRSAELGREPQPRHGFRPDIEGLRALAVLLVLLYHGQVDLVGGGYLGVDVFFAISGFLITRSLLEEEHSTGRVALGRFYARRIRRLLPASAVVLTGTALAAWRLLPETAWRDFGGDVAAAAGYVVNWRLAARSVDYLAEDVDISPVQHFWSLAVEEQFYLVWPLLILGALWLAARARRDRRATVGVVLLLVVVVPSLAASVGMTADDPGRAFFHTGTRMWELGLGGLAAVVAPHLAGWPRAVRLWGRVAALTVLVGGAVAVDATSPWPGSLALVAVGPTVVLLLLGDGEGRDPVDAVLAARPSQAVGRWSYSLYLWHWPPLAILAARWDGLTDAQALAIVAASVVPAVASYHLLEGPVRFSPRLRASPRLSWALGVGLTGAGLAAGLALTGAVAVVPTQPPERPITGPLPSPDDESRVPSQPGPPGAAALEPGMTDADLLATLDDIGPDDPIVPAPVAAADDLPITTTDGCIVREADQVEPIACHYGPSDASVRIVLVGDSKAEQWSTPLVRLAESNGWRLTVLTKTACELTTTMPDRGRPDEACLAWGANVLDLLTDDPPDLVLTSQVSSTAWVTEPGQDPEDLLVEGMRDAYRRLEEAGARVAMLLETPHPGISVYECVAEHRDDLRSCAVPRADDSGARPVQRRLAAEGEIDLVDLTDQVCPTATCLPVIGEVLVYRQSHHLTATYAATLAPALEGHLLPLLRAP